jgi:multicomponent Na+:H+ antiporter subunit G
MSGLGDIATIVLVSAGALLFLAGALGLLRFPDTLSRLHAISKADNLGLGLIVLCLLPQMASIADGLKLLCIWLLAQLS